MPRDLIRTNPNIDYKLSKTVNDSLKKCSRPLRIKTIRKARIITLSLSTCYEGKDMIMVLHGHMELLFSFDTRSHIFQ